MRYRKPTDYVATLWIKLTSGSKFSWASSLADQAWNCILEDHAFTDRYFKTLMPRLTEAYEHVTDFLKKHNIPYTPSNSGPFLWIDLSRLLIEATLEAERQLAWSMIRHGLWLATGEAYHSEQPGRFRMTFALPRADRDIGLSRYVFV